MVQQTLVVRTPGRGLHEITDRIAGVVGASGVRTGLCHVFVQHTSASLLIQENADPSVLTDLDDWFGRAVPDGDPRYRHRAEGPDDMAAHLRAALTAHALMLPVRDGALALGTWQGIFLFEHRTAPHRRSLVITVLS